MSAFRSALRECNPEAGARQWVYVPYDQLTHEAGPLAALEPGEAGVVLVENRWKANRRPYHRQKLGLVLTNMRNFALEQARRGVAVRYLHGNAPYSKILEDVIDDVGPLKMAAATERELHIDLQPLVESGGIEVEPSALFLTDASDFESARYGDSRYRMDQFYRHVRKKLGILLDDDGKPVGGKWSFDADNREPWSGDPPAPDLPRFETDLIREEVAELIAAHFDHHPGKLDLLAIPTTAAEHERWLDWVCESCMREFGPYEDAMSVKHTNIFHSRLSASINLGRLLPRTVIDRVLDLDIPLSSKEGFVRQLIGWREFMRHLHRLTDGFRTVAPVSDGVGDGGWGQLDRDAWVSPDELGGQADPQELDANRPIPPAFWGVESGLNCLDHVVETVWDEGYSHHITRLMILSNLATLIGVSPRSLTDWFWCAYIDAFDWVVEPNVLGMGSFGLGDLFTTKPYVSGAAYINRMSDYCDGCRFHPKKTCPITSMYWAFLDHNADRLDGNPRIAMPLRSLRKRGADKRAHDMDVSEWVRTTLAAGETLDPDDAPNS